MSNVLSKKKNLMGHFCSNNTIKKLIIFCICHNGNGMMYLNCVNSCSDWYNFIQHLAFYFDMNKNVFMFSNKNPPAYYKRH